jgi:polysaccharide biosynthesis transport protein
VNEAGDIARSARQREQAALREPATTRETIAALREIVGPGEAHHDVPFPTREQRKGFRPAPAAGPTPAASAAYADSGLRMRDLFAILRRRARLVGAVAVAGALLVGTLSALLPPAYVATAQIMVEPAASEVAAGLLAPVVDTHIILLTSEARLRRVFDDLNAEPRYIEASAAVGADPSFPERARFLLRDMARELGLVSRPVEPEAETPSTDLGPAQARAAMLVRQERQSSIISVSFQDRSAQRAALVANRMVTRHVQELGERRTQEAVGRQDFQKQRVEEARTEVEEAERLVRAFQVENGASVTDREGESVAEMTQQLVLLRSEIASRERDVGAPAAADEIRVIRLQADALEARLAELKAVQGSAVDRRIERQALDLRLDTARKNLTEQLRQLEESGKPQPAFASAARVVATAGVPTRPNSLSPVVVAVPALVAFGILGAMVALLVDRLATGYRNEREVEEELGVPCLGLVPRAPAGRASGASADLARSPWGRAVGGLALTLLHRCGRAGSPCVVLVTSCAREQDKAGLATALAAHARQNGLRVLLVRWDDDAALRQGFSSPLSEGGAALKSFAAAAFVRDPALGLDRPVSEKVERDLVLGLGGDRSVRVRHVLAYEYDLVVVDAPPVLASAQARVVAHDADAALLALAWGRTDRKVADQALRLLRRPLPLAGDEPAPDEHAILSVLTDVNLKAHARYRLGDVGEHLFEAERRWVRSRRTAPRPSTPIQKHVESASDKRPDIEPGTSPVPRTRAGA